MPSYAVPNGRYIVAPAYSWAYPLVVIRLLGALLLFGFGVACLAVFAESQRFVMVWPRVTDYQFVIFTNQSNPTIITQEHRSSALEITSDQARYQLNQTFVFKNIAANSTLKYVKAFITLQATQIVRIYDQLEYYIDLDGTGNTACTLAESLSGRGVYARLSQPQPVFYGVDQSVYNNTRYASDSGFLVENAPYQCINGGTDDITLRFEYQMRSGYIVYTNFLVFLIYSTGIALGLLMAFGWLQLSGWALRQLVIMQRESVSYVAGYGNSSKIQTASADDFFKKND